MSEQGIWVLAGAGLPAGARIMDMPVSRGDSHRWIDVCIMGQHLPQQYAKAEMNTLTPEACPALGLCPDCLGFGTNEQLPVFYPTSLDDLREPCGTCRGSGRPALHVTISRDKGTVTGQLDVVPHSYVPPREGTLQACLGCGNEEGSEYHQGPSTAAPVP